MLPNRQARIDADFALHCRSALAYSARPMPVDLKALLDYIFASLLGKDTKTRFRPHYFGYTEPSFEVDLTAKHLPKVKKEWIEIGGCGMVDPAVFEAVGYDPDLWSGYAFGMGLERLAMLLYGIDDIRYFYQNDLRFLKQFA